MPLLSVARRLYARIRSSGKSPHLTLRPWDESHAGMFDDEEDAYTLFIDGKRTDISFTVDETEIPPDGITKAEVTFPAYIASQGVEIAERSGSLATHSDVSE